MSVETPTIQPPKRHVGRIVASVILAFIAFGVIYGMVKPSSAPPALQAPIYYDSPVTYDEGVAGLKLYAQDHNDLMCRIGWDGFKASWGTENDAKGTNAIRYSDGRTMTITEAWDVVKTALTC